MDSFHHQAMPVYQQLTSAIFQCSPHWKVAGVYASFDEMSNSVATRQSSSKLGFALAAPSFDETHSHDYFYLVPRPMCHNPNNSTFVKSWHKGSNISSFIRIFTPRFNMFCDMID